MRVFRNLWNVVWACCVLSEFGIDGRLRLSHVDDIWNIHISQIRLGFHLLCSFECTVLILFHIWLFIQTFNNFVHISLWFLFNRVVLFPGTALSSLYRRLSFFDINWEINVFEFIAWLFMTRFTWLNKFLFALFVL